MVVRLRGCAPAYQVADAQVLQLVGLGQHFYDDFAEGVKTHLHFIKKCDKMCVTVQLLYVPVIPTFMAYPFNFALSANFNS